MNRVRVLTRLSLILVLLAAAFFVAKRTLLRAYVGSEPIEISATQAPATFERAFPNLTFERPIYLTFPPDGTDRIAVVSQFGRVLIFSNDPSVETATQLLDIRPKVAFDESMNEEGLLGLAFHPKFKENRRFFVYYTTKDHVNVLSRFELSANDPNRADPGSEQELFRTPPKPSWNHNGGTIIFGPEGYLYMALGDGGPVKDPNRNGQNLQTVFGKILRIDVDDQQPGLKYAIPKDNPFVNVAGARGEIWATGLRNVWRMSFDRRTNRLWAADVGEDTWEEVNLIERGGNYGWSVREGFRPFVVKNRPPALPSPAARKLTDPIFAYNHSIGNCIIGGGVYRGKKVPELAGAYLFGDHVTGRLYALRFDEGTDEAITVEPMQPAAMPVFSFGEDQSGEVYFMTTQGIVNRIVPLSR